MSTAWEVATAIALLVTGMQGVVWIAGKIYHAGILITARKPAVGELIRWLRLS